ncbi:MAG: YkgJ family cysteine cluster protein [Candidatus Sericytochromatia bacterium]|nr:YkgJ family cysteine cluster protein [Candidatus Sericytochromatia bacterium]
MRPIRSSEEQHRRFDSFAVMAAGCDNIGLSADQRDLYTLIDAVVTDVQAASPPFACRAGCNACCYTPPIVTSLEWQALHRHLLTLPTETQRQIVSNAEALRPLAPQLQAKRQARLTPDAPPLPSATLQCPMLVDGQCSVYRARPAICRVFGFFAHTLPDGARFFGSELALAHIQATMPPDLVLPKIEPFAERVGALHQGTGTQAYLPQWLWTHTLNGRISPRLDLSPAFN